MRGTKKRLDQVESRLKPKQVVLLWMQEAHQQHTMEDYAKTLMAGPDSAWPIPRLTEHIAESVRKAMKGNLPEQVDRAVREAVRDVVFLFYLHQRCNEMVAENLKAWSLQLKLLATQMQGLLMENRLSDDLMWAWSQASENLPYPLEPETAAAVEAAKKHYVMTWEQFEEGGYPDDWVRKSFVRQGKTELPFGAYMLKDRDAHPDWDLPTEEELRTLFQDSVGFDAFQAGDDYNYGLADVSDEEFEARCDGVYQALQKLVESGEVEAGKMVSLETVPNAFLQNVPLLEGEWIDRYVVELAEWGARMKAKGLSLQWVADNHPLAWESFAAADGEQSEKNIEKLEADTWNQTRKHMEKFSGRVREIDGRNYISFEDYRRWRGRRLKGNLMAQVKSGFVTASLWEWIDCHGGEGEAELLDVIVEKLRCYAEGYPYHTCSSTHQAMKERKAREKLMDSLEEWSVTDPHHPEKLWERTGKHQRQSFMERVLEWRELAEATLRELCLAQQAVEAIAQRYFEGHEVFFPAIGEEFLDILKSEDNIVEIYDGSIAEDVESHRRIWKRQGGTCDEEQDDDFALDVGLVGRTISNDVDGRVRYLVDMAKAEALDYLGEHRAAVELVERHLSQSL